MTHAHTDAMGKQFPQARQSWKEGWVARQRYQPDSTGDANRVPYRLMGEAKLA
ncbi:hypothetical protein VRRI112168_09555 [Vreelandella rituensis]|uniref:hypothetical protein n=1 Tax=Vreelandella rituensis TaxID=2282306 RepID=UPI0015F0C352|nr:hypothetical protein [Halomonas rituensis]